MLVAETDGTENAMPEGYAILGDHLYFGPTPDQAYAYKLPYYKHTVPIVDDNAEVSNKWLIDFFNYTTLATLHFFALTHLQGTEIAQKIRPELDYAFDGFARAVESRKHANMDYLLGDQEN
jgi:hypothetical protein